jgi:hypothetical protein
MEITVEEEVEEEEEPIPPAEEVEEEEEVQEQRSLSDEIEDEVDALVDDFLTRYGITN